MSPASFKVFNSGSLDRPPFTRTSIAAMQMLEFPRSSPSAEPAGAPRLAEILAESAYLLEASRSSEDADVREASIDLAIKSLRAASLALTPVDPLPARRRPVGRVIQGPWAAPDA